MKYYRRNLQRKKVGVKAGSRIVGGMSSLGGLTAPSWTGRPHMGPFNRVAPQKISDADEPYRQHDIGYSKITNPYLNYNRYDEDLLRSAGNSPADILAKAIFLGKKFVDIYQTPSLGFNRKKVYSVYVENPSDSNDVIEVRTDIPFPKFRSHVYDFMEGWQPSRDPNDPTGRGGIGGQSARRARDFRPWDDPTIPTDDDPGSTPSGGSRSGIRSKIYYEKF